MATSSLQVNRDIILATKKQNLKQRKINTPVDAVLALAQMQQRPRGLLNYSQDGEKITLIAQISRRAVYDPVTSALHCRVNGADAISFFTDHSIYDNDLDDMLMVARALGSTPVLFQNYVLDEYAVMAARAADASALAIYASLMPAQKLRQIVSMAQRWKMSTVVQIGDETELETALTLSPHALSFGDNLSRGLESTIEQIRNVHPHLPAHYKVLMTHTLHTLDDIELALQAPVDAVIVDESLLKFQRTAKAVREMLAAAQAARAGK